MRWSLVGPVAACVTSFAVSAPPPAAERAQRSAGGGAVKASLPRELPTALAPLDWNTTVRDLRQAFVRARVEVIEQAVGAHTIAIVSEVTVQEVGDARLLVERDASNRVVQLEISTDDLRPECRVDGRDPSDIAPDLDCRWRRGPALLGAFERLLERVQRDLGAPDGDLRGGEQRFVTWKRGDHQVSVSLRRGDDDGLWEAAVTAFRE